MRRVLLTIALVVATTATVLAPAAAAETGVVADRTTDRATDPPRLRCRGRINDAGEPVVRCRWRATQHPAAAGYKLIRRSAMEDRQVVFRAGLDAQRFVDTEVEFNTRYAYKLVVVNKHGRKLQTSRWNRAYVLSPDVERLAMACGVTDAAEKLVKCAWRPATSEKAVGYQLWRLVRGAEHRELVAEVGLDTLSVVDDLPDDATAAVYAVLAVDEAGEMVGRSPVQRVRFAVPEPTDALTDTVTDAST